MAQQSHCRLAEKHLCAVTADGSASWIDPELAQLKWSDAVQQILPALVCSMFHLNAGMGSRALRSWLSTNPACTEKYKSNSF